MIQILDSPSINLDSWDSLLSILSSYSLFWVSTIDHLYNSDYFLQLMILATFMVQSNKGFFFQSKHSTLKAGNGPGDEATHQ